MTRHDEPATSNGTGTTDRSTTVEVRATSTAEFMNLGRETITIQFTPEEIARLAHVLEMVERLQAPDGEPSTLLCFLNYSLEQSGWELKPSGNILKLEVSHVA